MKVEQGEDGAEAKYSEHDSTVRSALMRCKFVIQQAKKACHTVEGDDYHEYVSELVQWLACKRIEDWWINTTHD